MAFESTVAKLRRFMLMVSEEQVDIEIYANCCSEMAENSNAQLRAEAVSARRLLQRTVREKERLAEFLRHLDFIPVDGLSDVIAVDLLRRDYSINGGVAIKVSNYSDFLSYKASDLGLTVKMVRNSS